MCNYGHYHPINYKVVVQGLTLACRYVLFDLHGIGSNSILKQFSVHFLNIEAFHMKIHILDFSLKIEEFKRLGLHSQLAKNN